LDVAEVKSLRLGEVEINSLNLAVFDLGDWGFRTRNGIE